MASRVELRSKDGALAELLIDGKVVHGVRSVKFEKHAMNMPTLIIEMNALDISIDSPVVLKQKGYEDCEIKMMDGSSIFG